MNAAVADSAISATVDNRTVTSGSINIFKGNLEDSDSQKR